LPDWWEHLHAAGDPTGLDPHVDYDGDGQTARDEFIAGTDPFDAASVFLITTVHPLYADTAEEIVWTDEDPQSDTYGMVFTQTIHEVVGNVLSWPSVGGRAYRVEYATNLVSDAFVQLPGATNLPATPPVNVFTNTPLPEEYSPVYYRARVWIEEE